MLGLHDLQLPESDQQTDDHRRGKVGKQGQASLRNSLVVNIPRWQRKLLRGVPYSARMSCSPSPKGSKLRRIPAKADWDPDCSRYHPACAARKPPMSFPSMRCSRPDGWLSISGRLPGQARNKCPGLWARAEWPRDAKDLRRARYVVPLRKNQKRRRDALRDFQGKPALLTSAPSRNSVLDLPNAREIIRLDDLWPRSGGAGLARTCGDDQEWRRGRRRTPR